MAISDWSTTAADNDDADATINWLENQAPSTVNNSARAMMAATRAWYDDYEWRDWGHTVTYATTTTFTISGDVTAIYTANRPIRCEDSSTLYGYVFSSSYGAPNTTVTVLLDSGSLSVSLSSVALGIDPTYKSVPKSAVRLDPFIDWISASQIGTALSIANTSSPAMTALSFGRDTYVAYIDGNLDSLRTYWFNGDTWALIGSGLSISNTNPAITRLSDTDIAYIDDTNDELRTYRFNGSTWSLVGSGLSISGVSLPALASLSSTNIAFTDSGNDELRTYTFDGSSWSLVGSALSLTAFSSKPGLTSLNSTDVAFIDFTSKELRAYRFNGSTWSQLGSVLDLGTDVTGHVTLTALNGTDIAAYKLGRTVPSSLSDEIRTYRFDGSSWSQIGGVLAVTGSDGQSGTICAINGIDIAQIDSGNDELRTYRFGFSIGSGPYQLDV